MGDRTRKIKGTGSPMAHTGGYKPFVKHEKGAGHKGQPDGKSIGYGSKRDYGEGHHTGTGKQHGHMAKPVAGVEDGRKNHGHEQKHSSLTYKSNDGGKSFGVAGFPGGSSFKGRMGQADCFKDAGSAADKASGFRHQGGLRQGALRMSGDPRAHRVGARGKGR